MSGLPEASARIERFVDQHMRAANTPGMAVALTDREGLIRLSTHGYADVAAQAPVMPDKLFEIGSLEHRMEFIVKKIHS